MARSDLEKFQLRLSLVDYFRHVFGVEEVTDHESVVTFYQDLEKQREGYNAEGRSYVANALEGRVRSIGVADLLRYDANVKRHTDALNRHRNEPITLKYFQILAALMTERYLDQISKDQDAFLNDLNSFVDEQKRLRNTRINLPSFTANDLNKLAFWMATGSGKTLVMHLNYYQYLHYRPSVPDNILLVTPNEGLSDQHMAEMQKSGIPYQHFNANTSNLLSVDPRTVKVIEITKLTEDKTGGGKSVDISHLGDRNLIFVDEGHKGAGGEAWMGRRAAVANNGFTFEYSATFGQGIGGESTDIQEEYGRAIIFDYSYPRFYADGYGKDYRILNLEHDLAPELTDRYLLANLLTFYEQVRCYEINRRLFYNEYNIEPPLLTFVGHTVAAGKTWSGLGKNDKRSLSDVQNLVRFLYRVVRNEKEWVPQTIDMILSGKSGLLREDGSDLFVDAFRTLREARLAGQAIYRDMLGRVFHVRQATDLHLVDLQSAEGEIGLRAGPADRIFGLINIGDAANFLKLAEDKLPEIEIKPEQFSGSLFQAINQQDSPINILLGAKKFIEGWDSWRVSTMGLMNIGRGEGPQIIQLFGRGVRLLGKDRTLKRSKELEGDHPDDLPHLETVNIFGVRAKYMTTFRDYLEKEGIDTDEREIIQIETEIGPDYKKHGLLTIRPQIDGNFEDEVRLVLEFDRDCRPTLNLTPQAQALVSNGLLREIPEFYEVDASHYLPAEAIDLFDWEKLFHEIWRFRMACGYNNLALKRSVLRQIIEEQQYELLCPASLLELSRFHDLDRLQQIAVMILRKYVDLYYIMARRHWEYEYLTYVPLDGDPNLVNIYEAEVKRSASEFLATLQRMLNDRTLYENDEGDPKRVHFDRHLYLPLLCEDTHEPEPVVKYSPPGINAGEFSFVKRLRDYATSNEGQNWLEKDDRHLFLLRNQSRGQGVGFLIRSGERFFPDFILWLKSDARQDIVFIDPHGLIMSGDLNQNSKVQFYRQIKEYEQRLNDRAQRQDIVLHSYIISSSPLAKLSTFTGLNTFNEYNTCHVYFPEQDDYIPALLEDVMNDI